MSSIPRKRQGACPSPVPAGLLITATHAAGEHLLKPRGEVDMATVPTLMASIARAEADGADRVVFDLGAVTFIDSCAVHALLELRERLEHRGGALVIRPGPLQVQRVLDICELGGETSVSV